MGLFFRKSQKIGPFRINFSTSGIGVSADITGARVSVGPKGTYVHLGRHGVYYRKKLSSIKERSTEPVDLTPHPVVDEDNHSITTLNFDNLSDSDSQEFINELEEKDYKIVLLPFFGVVPSAIILLFFASWSSMVIKTVQVRADVFNIDKQVVNLRDQPAGRSIFH